MNNAKDSTNNNLSFGVNTGTKNEVVNSSSFGGDDKNEKVVCSSCSVDPMNMSETVNKKLWNGIQKYENPDKVITIDRDTAVVICKKCSRKGNASCEIHTLYEDKIESMVFKSSNNEEENCLNYNVFCAKTEYKNNKVIITIKIETGDVEEVKCLIERDFVFYVSKVSNV